MVQCCQEGSGYIEAHPLGPLLPGHRMATSRQKFNLVPCPPWFCCLGFTHRTWFPVWDTSPAGATEGGACLKWGLSGFFPTSEPWISSWQVVQNTDRSRTGLHQGTLKQVKISEGNKCYLGSFSLQVPVSHSATGLVTWACFPLVSLEPFPPAEGTSFTLSNSCSFLGVVFFLNPLHLCFYINLPIFQILPFCLSHSLWMCL